MARILIIDDEEPIRFSLRGILEDEGYEVLEAATAEEGLEVADAERPDLVFLDIWLPGMDGLTAQARLKGNHPDLPVVMISGHGTIETAVSAIQQGAYDFIEKPLSLEKVVIVAARALEAGSLRRENQVLRTVLPEQDELIGQSPVMLKFQELLARVAPTDVWVLLTGENGTGKDMLAREIHALSARRDESLVSVDMGALTETLFESELFGHVKGAFTDARSDRAGKFEVASGGTLFLDEIGEMPLDLQSKLLRVIQEKEVRRIGASRVIPVDVRIIAATNKDLNGEVAANRFRADLYYRLNILHLHLPPLRAYTESAGEIAEKILRKLAPGSESDRAAPLRALLAKTGQYRWPGNLRELENIVRRYLALSPYLSRSIKLSDIFEPSELAEGPRESGGWENSGELQKVLATYYRMGCSKTLTAQELGISRSTLWRKLKQIRNPDS